MYIFTALIRQFYAGLQLLKMPILPVKILKGQKKHVDEEQGKTKHEAPRSVNYRGTQNKNNIGTTALERSVVYTTGGGWGG